MLIGTVGVVLARGSRDAQAGGVQLQDHWHAAYQITACGVAQPGQFDDPGISTADAGNIHAHAGDGGASDGMMHIHPRSSAYTQSNGTIGAFLETVGSSISDDSLTLARGANGEEVTFSEEEGCEGIEGEMELRVAKWNNGVSALNNDPDTIFSSGLNRISFDQNGEAYAIFFGPANEDILGPPSAPNLPSVDSSLTPEAITGTTVSPTDTTTGDSTPDDSAPDDSSTDDSSPDTTEAGGAPATSEAETPATTAPSTTAAEG